MTNGRAGLRLSRSARAFEENQKHYADVFTNGNQSYANQRDAQSDPVKLRQLNSFFFWTAWAAVTNRPGQTISYTSNFPAEPLVANSPTSGKRLFKIDERSAVTQVPVMGALSKDYIVSLVERKTVLVLIGKLSDHTKESFNRRLLRLIRWRAGALSTSRGDNGTDLHG